MIISLIERERTAMRPGDRLGQCQAQANVTRSRARLVESYKRLERLGAPLGWDARAVICYGEHCPTVNRA